MWFGCCGGVCWLFVGQPAGFKQVAGNGFKPVECEGVVVLLGLVLCLSLSGGLLACVAVVLVAWLPFMFFFAG